MINTKNEIYGKAFVEVEAALNCLCLEDYKKIPQEVIDAIAENKNENYIYDYDEELDYEDWEFMSESQGILYNIFKKYLATEEQRQYVNQKEMFEESKLEEERRRNYNPDNIFKKEEIKIEETKTEEKITDLVEYKESFIKRIFNKIISFFRKKQ